MPASCALGDDKRAVKPMPDSARAMDSDNASQQGSVRANACSCIRLDALLRAKWIGEDLTIATRTSLCLIDPLAEPAVE